MHLGPRWTIVDTKAIGQAVGAGGMEFCVSSHGTWGCWGAWMDGCSGGCFPCPGPAVTIVIVVLCLGWGREVAPAQDPITVLSWAFSGGQTHPILQTPESKDGKPVQFRGP